MKYLTDEQYDELFEHLQGTRKTQAEGLATLNLKGYKLTKEQRIHRDESYKRCRRCKTWMSSDEICNCL